MVSTIRFFCARTLTGRRHNVTAEAPCLTGMMFFKYRYFDACVKEL